MEIEVHQLKRHFGKTKAVDDVTFGFASGQIYGFVGPNGAGKTTTMRIMATLDEPTSGDVRFDGVSVVEEPERARRQIGYMPDTLPAHRDMCVHEYLDLFARAYGLPRQQRRSTIAQIEQFTNLTGIREKLLRALSKGMKQRVSLARALVHDPPLLIMDEPAAGLDPRARVELRELIKALADQGKAVLISSHILAELTEICDGAVIIEQGRLLRAGTLEAIERGDGEVANRRAIALRPHGSVEALYKAMLEMPKVTDARVVGDHVEADVEGDEDDCCDLLAELLRREFRILEFKQVRQGLEQLFMSLTEGKVQ
ncbi:ABC transporter ATP-binding protein [Phycisphaerales bacterium AB-hyl4]|uniref:ABC transporter ATP-binding protein n=1 Tax=Natronomicrosphaera hydrolytica TaxID=3242702 RepID=A0ABV4U5J6_9BACT